MRSKRPAGWNGLRNLAMTLEEKLETIAAMPLGELQLRRRLINNAIRACLIAGDPLGGASKYREQLARIENEIRGRQSKNGHKPVIIQAKPARMGAKAKR